ncbi:MAG: nucleotidyl transferase AbiEii/AbiGii toxin family protein [Bacteroidetes bacterium]|nr:nucleotidyl transferase AbiEii/AbiGii toxin family protein [Bacteroidota bacterium]
MLNLTEIEKQYPENLRYFKRFIIREYLQHKILKIIFESAFSHKLCFLGGTCLRIVHGNQRFSEDLDFDNFKLSEKNFEAISKVIKAELEKEGYLVDFKNVYKGAFHCHIKFPGLLFQEGLSGHKDERILIQLDTEAQEFKFTPQSYLLNKFDVFTQISITPLDLLLAQKFYAICNRKQAKGRDFFDAVFLMNKTQPNYDYLKLKLKVSSSGQLKNVLLKKCAQLNMNEMANDVKPFLFNPNDINKIILFPKLIEQELL